MCTGDGGGEGQPGDLTHRPCVDGKIEGNQREGCWTPTVRMLGVVGPSERRTVDTGPSPAGSTGPVSAAVLGWPCCQSRSVRLQVHSVLPWIWQMNFFLFFNPIQEKGSESVHINMERGPGCHPALWAPCRTGVCDLAVKLTLIHRKSVS